MRGKVAIAIERVAPERLLRASITASATLHPLRLSQWSSRRTERRGRYLDGSQNGGKQGVGLLPEKPLCCGRSVRPGAEKAVLSRSSIFGQTPKIGNQA